MEILKKLFPHAIKATEVNSLIVALIIYIVIAVVGGALIGALAGIAVIGWLFGLLGGLVDLYATVGVVLAILAFLKILK